MFPALHHMLRHMAITAPSCIRKYVGKCRSSFWAPVIFILLVLPVCNWAFPPLAFIAVFNTPWLPLAFLPFSTSFPFLAFALAFAWWPLVQFLSPFAFFGALGNSPFLADACSQLAASFGLRPWAPLPPGTGGARAQSFKIESALKS